MSAPQYPKGGLRRMLAVLGAIARLHGQRYLSPPKSGAFGSNLLRGRLNWTRLAAHLVIESETEPTLDQMLAAFDPCKHGGEVMADAPLGAEIFA